MDEKKRRFEEFIKNEEHMMETFLSSEKKTLESDGNLTEPALKELKLLLSGVNEEEYKINSNGFSGVTLNSRRNNSRTQKKKVSKKKKLI